MQKIIINAVESTQIHGIGHDAETNTLAIQFKRNSKPDSVYHYANVSAEMFAEFSAAESIGSYFYKHIKPHPDKYPYVKVPSAEASEADNHG